MGIGRQSAGLSRTGQEKGSRSRTVREPEETTKSMPMWGRYQFARYSTVTDLARFLG
jgi:galactose-1-phosphate uridylyltransferase